VDSDKDHQEVPDQLVSQDHKDHMENEEILVSQEDQESQASVGQMDQLV